MQQLGRARRGPAAVAAAVLLGISWIAALGGGVGGGVDAFVVTPAAHRRLAPRPVVLAAAAAAADPSPCWSPPHGPRSLPFFPRWRRQRRSSSGRPLHVSTESGGGGGPVDVGNDPSGATIVPEAYPPIEPTPPGPNPKAILALVAGELLLGLLAFPLGYAFKVSPLSSIKQAFSSAATAAVGGLGPAMLNALGLGLVFTLPALVLHKVSGQTIEDLLRESLQQIFGAPETTRRRPLRAMAIALILSLSAGLGEEILFRGTLQPLVASLARSEYVGVALSSFVFAALHAATPRYLLLAFVLSVYLGFIQISVGNLFIPIVVHTIFDVVGFAMSLFEGKGKGAQA